MLVGEEVLPKVTLTFRLDSSGMVRLVKADAKATIETAPVATIETEGSEPVKDEDEAAPPTPPAVNATEESGNSTANATAKAEPKAPAPVILSKSLDVTVTYEGLKLRPATPAEKEESKVHTTKQST